MLDIVRSYCSILQYSIVYLSNPIDDLFPSSTAPRHALGLFHAAPRLMRRGATDFEVDSTRWCPNRPLFHPDLWWIYGGYIYSIAWDIYIYISIYVNPSVNYVNVSVNY